LIAGTGVIPLHWLLTAIVMIATAAVGGHLALAQSPSSEDTFSDRRIINLTLQEQLEHGRSHESVAWHNLATGHGGEIVVFPAERRGDTFCRPYEFTWSVNTHRTRYRGVPCRDARGVWTNFNETQVADTKPLEFRWAGVPASFDCARAARIDELLICSDPRAADLDAEMGRRFTSRTALLAPPDRINAVREQVQWAAQRNRRCGISEALVVTARDQWQRLVACLAAETTARSIVLQSSTGDGKDRPEAVDRDVIVQIQRNLLRLAYFEGTESGLVDSRLDTAIREFERDEGLPVTGKPSMLVVERSRRTIEGMKVTTGCPVGREAVYTRRICGRVGQN
jgi:surface antigen/uncharacterized protein YecT (DUF1311 family)